MKTLIVLALIILFSPLGTLAQKDNANQVYQSVSGNIVFPVIVAQDDSPFFVERFLVVEDEKGRIETEYKLRNIGSKAIRSYRVARIYSDNTGFVQFGVMPPEGRLLKPKMSIDTFTSKRILPPPDGEKRESAMKKIVFFMVVDVEFEDGTMFDANSTLKSFEQHLKLYESAYESLNE